VRSVNRHKEGHVLDAGAKEIHRRAFREGKERLGSVFITFVAIHCVPFLQFIQSPQLRVNDSIVTGRSVFSL
jgi:hypothetical protein